MSELDLDKKLESLAVSIIEKANSLGYVIRDGLDTKEATIYLPGTDLIPVIDIYYRGINFYLNGLVSCQSYVLDKEIYRFALSRGSGATDSKWYCQYYIYPDAKINNFASLSFLRYLEWHEPNRLYKVKLNKGVLPVNLSFRNCIFNDNLWHSDIPTHIDVNESRFEKNADKIEYFIEDALKNMLKSYNAMRKDEKVNDIQACASEYEV